MLRSTKMLLGSIAALCAVAGFTASADAQLRPWDSSNQVMVDLSVLSDNGVGPTPTGPVALPSLTGHLLDPPARMPRSRILVKNPPVAGVPAASQELAPVKLRRPGTVRKKTASKPRSRAPKMATKTAMKAPPPKPEMKVSKPATKLAPAPKARPKPPVKAVAAPPPPPKVAAPVKAPPQKPAVKMPEKPKAPQVAAVSQAAPAPAGGNLIFKQGDAKLSAEAAKSLDAMAAKLQASPKSRMQLLAYAGEPNLSASKARRLSLSRALSVRSYLIKKGVRSTRIDVRALGNKVPSGAPNRVELKVIGN